MPFGAHMSIAGGVSKAFARGEQVGCEAMQIFSKNERQWVARPLPEAEIAAFKAEQARSGIGPVIVHDSYLINLAAPADELWEKSMRAFADELERCALLDIPYLVTHPGAHTGSGEEAGLEREAVALNRLFAEGVGGTTTVLLETTAGQGTALGHRFEHLARLFELVPHHDRMAVCVDTCHIFAAGYDIRTPTTYAATFAEFDRLVGLDRIKCFHVNDSQKDLGSRVDRHAHIGQGFLGLEAFRLLVNDPRFRSIPKIIETPKGDAMLEDIENLTLLRSLVAL
ncbi:deoxyribonuclease IV [Candidatus Chloroploca sp. M-50]|uniref:Probable endonuclease 4 n=1 Tax=Candidatus Chloroploca mongolica TaxID=2528176 RepID=A0ABS4DC75_9CHLR|nr:deoxyribonuclease IV [Candidatus Chloroploca mongolica]MBP1466904.1 deoxyribonuclease IV [Candidatus Chloroploca mongolica]